LRDVEAFRVPLEPERPPVDRERPPLEDLPRLDAERARLVLPLPRELPPLVELCSLDSDASSSPSSSPFPRNFFATPTAAGTATPSAAPATTFWVVDIPSSSFPPFSSFIPSSLSATIVPQCSGWVAGSVLPTYKPLKREG
jgi:hypothetical protein